MKKTNEYRYGRKKEAQVARSLRGSGFKCTISPGSKGPSDIQCTKGRRKWKVQVKASRGSKAPKMTKEEQRRLRIQAVKTNSLPVVAEVIRGKILYTSLRSGRRVKP